MRKAFTLIELVVAVALLAMMISFASLIFDMSIDTHRTAMASSEIMQKLQAITGQLNADFKGLCKDGYLILYSEELENRKEFEDSQQTGTFRTDKLYYFSTGDSQSWFPPYVRSNIARVYLGHDANSLNNNIIVSKWNLARDIELLTPGISPLVPVDCNDISYAACKANIPLISSRAETLLSSSVMIDIKNPDEVRRLICQNVGEMIIEWTDGADPNGLLDWEGEDDTEYRWTPDIPQESWPKAFKFTFTLYDSKGILKEGKTFTHIVYLGD